MRHLLVLLALAACSSPPPLTRPLAERFPMEAARLGAARAPRLEMDAWVVPAVARFPTPAAAPIELTFGAGRQVRVFQVGAVGQRVQEGAALRTVVGDAVSRWAVTPEGAEEWVETRHATEAPVARWRVEGAHLEAHEDAVWLVDDARRPFGRVTAPSARALDGRPARAWLTAEGSELRLHTDARGHALIDPLWTAMPALGTPRVYGTATLLPNGKVLFAGGTWTSPLKTAELYDPATGTYSATGSMAVERCHHTATLLRSGQVLVVGGSGLVTGPGTVARPVTAELYDPATGTFSPTGATLEPHEDHTATMLPDGRVLIAGGATAANVETDGAELYDPSTGTFTATTNRMPRASWRHSAALLPNGKVLVAGGSNSVSPSSGMDTLLYSVADGWVQLPLSGRQYKIRAYYSLTVLPDGRALAVGGNGVPANEGAELFDPATNTWSLPFDALVERSQHTATLLPDGRVLLTGGITPASQPTTTLYDSATGTFASGPPLSENHNGHTATLLPSGQVLLSSGTGTAHATELFDPQWAGSWAATGNLAVGRADFTLALAPTGRALAVGGYVTGDGAATTTEAYNPSTGTWSVQGGLASTSMAYQPWVAPLPTGGAVAIRSGGGPVELYQPSTGTWTAGAAAGPHQYGAEAPLPDGRKVVCGGHAGNDYVISNGCEAYDDLQDRWVALAPMNVARWRFAATPLKSGLILVAAGTGPYGTPAHKTTELYDPVANTWTPTGDLPSPRFYHAAAALPNGGAAVFGGHNGSAWGGYTDLFDPLTKQWTSAPPIPEAPARTSPWKAVTLPSGRVLLLGGSSSALATWIFNPATKGWTAGAQALKPRLDAQAVLLPNGKVLAAGDRDYFTMAYFQAAELFDEGRGESAAQTPSITTATSPLVSGAPLTLSGLRFTGALEGSAGGTQTSSANVPVIQLQAVEGGMLYTVKGGAFTNTQLTGTLPADLPRGHYLLRVVTAGVPSAARLVKVEPSTAISPRNPTVPPRATVGFSAQGGLGAPYTWALVGTPSTGAAVDPASGVYTAGPTPLVQDILSATDPSGSVGTTTISVGPGVSVSPDLGQTTVPPRGTVTFTASGGQERYLDGGLASYSYSLNPGRSGGIIHPATGIYRAGDAGSVTDVVQAMDELGNTGTWSLAVGPGVSLVPATRSAFPKQALTFSATGGQGFGFSYSLATNASGGTINALGSYLAGPTGGVTDVVRVVDPLGNSATGTVAVGPGVSVTPGTLTVAPRGTASLSASGGSGTGFTWSVDGGSGPTVGATTGVYEAGWRGPATDVVQVRDSLGNVGALTVTVTDAVALTPLAPQTPPRGAVQFTATGVDLAGATFSTSSADGGPAHGAIDPLTGLYAAGDGGLVDDEVRVTDAHGNTARTTVHTGATVTISPPAPTLAPREAVTFTASGGSDAGFTWSLLTNAAGGALDPGSATYTAGTAAHSTAVVELRDSLGNAATATVTVGAGLSLTSSGTTVAPRATRTVTAQGGKAPYTFSLAPGATGSTISPAGLYLAGAAPGATDTVQASDAVGNTASLVLTIGPGVSAGAAPTSLKAGESVSLTCSGGVGAPFAWQVGTNAGHGTVTPQGQYTAARTGNVTDTVTCADSVGNSATFTFAVGAPLTITNSPASVIPSGKVTLLTAGGSGAITAWTITSSPAAGSIDATGTYTAGSSEGADTVRVTDSFGNTATGLVTTSAGLALSPGLVKTAPRGQAQFQATGGSGQGFTFTLLANPSGGAFDAATRTYTAGATGNCTDVLRVTDSVGNTASATIQVGAGVSLTPPSGAVPPGAALQFQAAGGKGAPFTWSLVTNASGGAVDASGHYVAGRAPGVTDVVRVADALGNTAEASVQVGAGVALTPDGGVTSPLGALSFAASGGSGLGFTYAMKAAPSGGAVNPTTGQYVAGTVGNVTDVVQARDSLGNLGEAAVTVGAGVSVTPAVGQVPPRGTLTLTALGGAGLPFTWALRTTGSGQGATIDPGSGQYQAGARGGAVDVVTATDGLGNVGVAEVHTGPGVSLTPAAPFVSTSEAVAFAATGGSDAGFTFELKANNSGATLEPATGRYTAGRQAGTVDVLGVTDSLGNQAQATITVQAPVSVTPATAQAFTGDTVQFQAAGGSESGYRWSLAANPSGGAVDQGSGRYTAGEVGDVTDVVVVTDGNGKSAQASVQVRARLLSDGGTVPLKDKAPVAGWPLPTGCGCSTDSPDAGARGVLFALALLALLTSRRRRGAAVVATLGLALTTTALAAVPPKAPAPTRPTPGKPAPPKPTPAGTTATPAPAEPRPPTASPVAPPAVAPTAPAATPPQPARPSVAVLEVEVTVPGEKLDSAAFTDLLTSSMDGAGMLRVMGARDVTAILGLERQRALMGNDEGAGGLAEAARALGSDLVAATTVGKVGSSWLVTCRLIDGRQSRVLARASVPTDSAERLMDALWTASQQVLDGYGASLAPAEATRWAARPRQERPTTLQATPAARADEGTGLGLMALAVGGFQPLSSAGHRGSVGGEVALTLRASRLELQVGAVIAPSPGARLAVGWAVLKRDTAWLALALRGTLYPGLGLLGGGPALQGEWGLSPRLGLTASLALDAFPTQDQVLVSTLAGLGVAAHF